MPPILPTKEMFEVEHIQKDTYKKIHNKTPVTQVKGGGGRELVGKDETKDSKYDFEWEITNTTNTSLSLTIDY